MDYMSGLALCHHVLAQSENHRDWYRESLDDEWLRAPEPGLMWIGIARMGAFLKGLAQRPFRSRGTSSDSLAWAGSGERKSNSASC